MCRHCRRRLCDDVFSCRRHAQCAEVLVQNGASPLVLDNARHNSALHWAASCCRADCVGRLLGSGALFQMQSGQLVAIAGGIHFLSVLRLLAHSTHDYGAPGLRCAALGTSMWSLLKRRGYAPCVCTSAACYPVCCLCWSCVQLYPALTSMCVVCVGPVRRDPLF